MKNSRVYLRIIMGMLLLLVGNTQAWGAQSTYYGRGTATVSSASPTGSGTVYVSTTNSSSGTYANTSSATGSETGAQNSSATVTLYAFAQANENYEFVGWNTANGTTNTTSTTSPYTFSINASSTNENNPTTANIYAIFAEKPVFYFSATAVASPAGGGTASVSPTTTNVRGEHWNSTSATTTATFTATPNTNYIFLGWSTTADGTVVSTDNPYAITITSTSTTSGSPTNTTRYARFAAIANPTGISATDIRISMGATITANNYTLTTSGGNIPYKHVTATSDNTSIATVAQSGDGFTITGVAVGSTTITVTAYNQDNTTPACSTTFTVIVVPEAGIIGNKVVLNDYEDHNWSYYNDPDCPIRSLSPADVKITYYGDGIMMTGDADYTASSTDFVQPGNGNYVGGASVNVATGEEQNTFIYYKTLERGDDTQTAWTFSSGNQSSAASRCPYTTIPNPFQVRPTYGTPPTSNRAAWTGWRGFQCWRLKSVSSGAVYSAASGGTALTTGAIINAETEIYFAPNSEYGMEVELEAVWAIAYLVYANNNGSWSVPDHAALGYERNFVVLSSDKDFYFSAGNGNTTAYISNVNRPSTITPYLPNGTSGNGQIGRVQGVYNNNANNRPITLQANTKFENVQITNMSGNTLTAAGYNLIVGRGCTGTVGTVRGLSGNTSGAVEYTIRLESGTFGTFNMIDGTTYTHSGTVSARTIFGSDYDRAKEDNSKLSIAANSTVYGGSSYQQFTSNTNRNNLTYDWLIKSGTVQSSKGVADGAAANCIYMGNSGSGNDSDGNRYQGKRRLVMEGGEVCNISGGLNNYGNNYATYIVNDGWAVQIRIKGGNVRGSVFGAAEFAGASGDRLFLFTGGTVNGWVAGGANGTQNTGGELYGSTAMYMGGNTVIGSSTGGTRVSGTSNYGTNGADGGHVFGAGCGILPANGNFQNGTVGRVNNSIVVVADNAHIWRDVHGGGNYGWVRDNGSTGIYIAGGTIGGINGYGNVFGGSNNQQGQEVSITVKGGDVKGGVYGGSHSWGTINDNVTMNISGGLIEQGAFGGGYGTNTNSCDVTGTVDITMTGGTVLYGLYGGGNVNCTIGQNVTMVIDGGTVGNGSANDGIYGGGYGAATAISGNVSITLGSSSSVDGVTVNGNVYGGSALGDVNTNNTNTTTVTMNKAQVNGNLFGAGKGNGADVRGKVTVTIAGGTVNGNVFGGGDEASYNIGAGNNYPVVTVTGGTMTQNIFGGGNNATVTGNPQVTIHSAATVNGNVYGGGNNGAVSGNTNVLLLD